jgi:hypothetical protein
MDTQVPSILWFHHFPWFISKENVEKAYLVPNCLAPKLLSLLLTLQW